jgi:hypothetical protein
MRDDRPNAAVGFLDARPGRTVDPFGGDSLEPEVEGLGGDSSSRATIRWTLASTAMAWRAAIEPIDTWSS